MSETIATILSQISAGQVMIARLFRNAKVAEVAKDANGCPSGTSCAFCVFRSVFAGAVFVAMMLASSATLSAQINTGIIVGTVTDPQGAVIANA